MICFCLDIWWLRHAESVGKRNIWQGHVSACEKDRWSRSTEDFEERSHCCQGNDACFCAVRCVSTCKPVVYYLVCEHSNANYIEQLFIAYWVLHCAKWFQLVNLFWKFCQCVPVQMKAVYITICLCGVRWKANEIFIPAGWSCTYTNRKQGLEVNSAPVPNGMLACVQFYNSCM